MTLNGQIIGQAERATRAVLEELLAEIGTTFVRWVTLNVQTTAGGRQQRDALVQRVVDGLRTDAPPVLAALDELTAAGHVRPTADDPAVVEVTDSGRAVYRRIQAGIDGISALLYADLPAADLATAGRVLTIVTERATAALAS
jgi:hypothetical protein